MLGRGVDRLILTTADVKQAAFLTLALLFSLVSHFSHADTPIQPDLAANRARLSQVESYLRQKTLSGVSLLPSEARTALGWFSGGHHIALSDADDGSAPSVPTSDFTSSAETDVPINLISNVHHKGFLPMHDAMQMGVGFGKNILNNKLQFTAEPFYGQGWRSLQGYWGAQASLNVVERPDGLPWGKLTFGYTGGNQSIIDHGSGLDLHGDLDLTHHVQLTAGLRQDNVTGDSNYLLLRWKMSFP